MKKNCLERLFSSILSPPYTPAFRRESTPSRKIILNRSWANDFFIPLVKIIYNIFSQGKQLPEFVRPIVVYMLSHRGLQETFFTLSNFDTDFNEIVLELYSIVIETTMRMLIGGDFFP